MYYYGGGNCGCNQGFPYMGYGYNNYGYGNQSSNYAIILVLFILLVIIIGSRFN